MTQEPKLERYRRSTVTGTISVGLGKSEPKSL